MNADIYKSSVIIYLEDFRNPYFAPRSRNFQSSLANAIASQSIDNDINQFPGDDWHLI
ncbi:hypothetical protein [Nostoc sp. DSM 114161]|uniref:hypothetical protein n=1 Tax=Nostoc sp. DSM 114161 TaxID=3440143 RepID=UPI004046304E